MLSPALFFGAAGLLAAGLLLGVVVGPAGIGAVQVLGALIDLLPGVRVDHGLTATQEAILWQVRAPRVVLGAMVGGSLSVAGAAYQGVFRNPLADPFLLGVAAGAGLGATTAIAIGVGSHPLALPLAAFAGATLGVVATYTLGRSVGASRSTSTIVLAGVAVAAFLTAIQMYVMQRNTDSLREVYAWMMGRLGTPGWSEVRLIAPYVAVAMIAIIAQRRLLDVLSVGEDEATNLGVHTGRVRLALVLAATLVTAAAVAVSGLIGFVGIVVPHAVRLIFGSSYRLIIPLSILGGGLFLVVTDVLARTLVAPAELPIGVVTAFVGAPFFTVVLRTSRRSIS